MNAEAWAWWIALAVHLGGTSDLYPADPTAARCYWIRLNGGPPADFDRAPFIN